MVYWIMLIWVLAVYFFLRYRMTEKVVFEDGSYEYTASAKYSFLLFCVPLVLIALRTDFVDTSSYIATFKAMPSTLREFGYIEKFGEARFFYGFQAIFKVLISKSAFVWIAAIACVQSYLVMHTLRKYSVDLGLSTFLFVAGGLVGSWLCNGIRQFIVVAIFFACTQWILDNKWYFFLPLAVFLMGFEPIFSPLNLGRVPWFLDGVHQSVLIFILAYFFINGRAFSKRIWLLAIALIILILTNSLDSMLNTSVENTTYVHDMENVDADTGTNIFRVLVQIAPFAMALFAKDDILDSDPPPIIHLAVNCSAVNSILYIASAFTSAIYVGRLPVYFEVYNLILIPWMLSHTYKANRKIIQTIIMLAYMAYFFYQVSITWADTPYVISLPNLGA